MPVVETFFGYVETTKDSLLLLEACRQGNLPRARRRLQEQERHLVKSGAVFCFDENESGIKRWTDGLVWSPSRILGNFLIYRELDDRKNITDDDDHDTNSQQQQQQQQIITSGLTLLSKRQRERSLVGSLRNSYRFKPNGLIKKSMSVVVNGVHQHLVSYYNKDDVVANRFKTPSDIPELAMLEISSELLDGQNFRIPFFIGNEANSISTTNTALSGDKRTTSVKTSTTERPTKQKKRASSYVQMLSNTPSPLSSSSSSSSRQYSNNNKNNTNNNSSNDSTPSPRHSISSSVVSLLEPPPIPSSSLISVTPTYNLESIHDEQSMPHTSTYHHLASYSQPPPPPPPQQQHHLILPLTQSSNELFYSPSPQRQNSITDHHSMVHHHHSHMSSPQIPQQQQSSIGSDNGALDMTEGCSSYMTMYNGTTTTTTKSPGMVSDTLSTPNRHAYYQHHHRQQPQHHHHLDIHSDNSSTTTSNSSKSRTPSTSYGCGSDAHMHPQWAPHSFSTGYSTERYDQNPHQHLFSSNSFHSINHAAMPTRTNELVSNAFMFDTNALLGSGWNDFEMQM